MVGWKLKNLCDTYTWLCQFKSIEMFKVAEQIYIFFCKSYTILKARLCSISDLIWDHIMSITKVKYTSQYWICLVKSQAVMTCNRDVCVMLLVYSAGCAVGQMCCSFSLLVCSRWLILRDRCCLQTLTAGRYAWHHPKETLHLTACRIANNSPTVQ